jgi:hypothetical protein
MAVSTEALRKLQKGLGLWIRLQRSALLVLVGLLITGVSNELHLKFERENARRVKLRMQLRSMNALPPSTLSPALKIERPFSM